MQIARAHKKCVHYHEQTEALKVVYTRNMTYKEALCQISKTTIPSTSQNTVVNENNIERKQTPSLSELSTRLDKL